MKNLMIFALLLLTPLLYGQQFEVNEKNTQLSIAGTSTVHDWIIEANQFDGQAIVTMEDNALQTIQSLTFHVAVESLKSGKSAMDDNTYEALKADKHPLIKYVFQSMEILEVQGSTTKMSTKGTLSIAGISKTVNMNVTADTKNGLTFSGDITFKMSVFKIEPPTAVFGTIKTGDEVTIKFNAQYK